MNFRFYFRKTQALGITALLGSLAACTNNIKSDSGHTRTEGASAAPGAATAGPVADSAGGAASGDSVAKKKEGSATRESALDTQIKGIHQQVVARQQYNEKLRALVAAKEQQLSTILASDRSAGPSAQEFDLRTSINSKLGELDREAGSWQETIDAHKAVMKKAADDPHGADLQREIDQFSEQRAELLRQRAKLAALPDKLKPQ